MSIAPGTAVEALDTPVLLVDGDALARNIARIKDLARHAGIAYRPHAKTHKSPLIAAMQIDAGAVGICCAKLAEAEVMAAAGIDDILITTEVVGAAKIARLMAACRLARIRVVVDDEKNISELAEAARAAGIRLDVLVDVDVGMARTGVATAADAARLANIIARAQSLRFNGLQGYHGGLQMMAAVDERADQVGLAMDRLEAAAELVRSERLEIETLTGGGTGTSVVDLAAGRLNELQPGSYVFMDASYSAIEWRDGAPPPFENALTLMATVVSRPAPEIATVDIGYKAASMDSGPIRPIDLPGAAFTFMGDEHGRLTFENRLCPLAVGDKVHFIPSHCDTTINLYDRYVVTSAGTVTAIWDIAARGMVQ
jgi:D-serine deaminase-like pyridoxal phosphate-dependent protein